MIPYLYQYQEDCDTETEAIKDNWYIQLRSRLFGAVISRVKCPFCDERQIVLRPTLWKKPWRQERVIGQSVICMDHRMELQFAPIARRAPNDGYFPMGDSKAIQLDEIVLLRATSSEDHLNSGYDSNKRCHCSAERTERLLSSTKSSFNAW